MNSEWIFDNAFTLKLQKFISQNFADAHLLNFDVSKIKWKTFIQNHAYGIKKYVLHEEAYLPSSGFVDANKKLYYPYLNINPFNNRELFYKKIKSYDETKALVMSTPSVLEAMEDETKKLIN